jgi:hypothetical protein
MRYFIQPRKGKLLDWLLKRDANPSIIPVFPDNDRNGLVVAYLLNGTCYAEVLTSKDQLFTICGKGFPFGRLFFHVKKVSLFPVCEQLTGESFKGPP